MSVSSMGYGMRIDSWSGKSGLPTQADELDSLDATPGSS